MTEMAPSSAAIEVASETPRPHAGHRLLKNPLGLVALAILAIAIITSALAALISPFDPNATDLGAILNGPSVAHPLGSDGAGRDVLSRLFFGGRYTLASAALAVSVAALIGVPTGLLAGYFGGWLDSVSNWTASMVMSLPSIIVLLAVRAVAGPSIWISMAIFGVILAPGFFRLVRSLVRSVRGDLYVDAARVSGLGDTRIIGRHIFTVVRAPIVIQAAMAGGVAIAVQSGLEFLGLGDPKAPTWGAMLNDGFRNIYTQPLLMLWPAAAIILTTAALALLGNALRDALEDRPRIKLSRRHASRLTTAASTTAATPKAPTEGSPAAVQVSGLAIGYPSPGGKITKVVHDVNFHVDRGEVLGLVGESGSGKSQSAFAILGLLPPEAIVQAGSIRIDGTETVKGDRIAEAVVGPMRGKRVAYIPQEPMSNLDPTFTIGHQLVRPMVKVLGISKQAAKKRVLELLAQVGIVDPARTFAAYPHEISGGMAQRVLIAGAVSCDPDLIIADEPTTALDVTVQAEVLELLRDLQQTRKTALLVVTHNFGVVADLCDRVAVMQSGRIVETGEVRTVLNTPQHSYTKSLLAATLEGKEPLKLLNQEENVR